jgi:hypothetical protein
MSVVLVVTCRLDESDTMNDRTFQGNLAGSFDTLGRRLARLSGSLFAGLAGHTPNCLAAVVTRLDGGDGGGRQHVHEIIGVVPLSVKKEVEEYGMPYLGILFWI